MRAYEKWFYFLSSSWRWSYCCSSEREVFPRFPCCFIYLWCMKLFQALSHLRILARCRTEECHRVKQNKRFFSVYGFRANVGKTLLEMEFDAKNRLGDLWRLFVALRSCRTMNVCVEFMSAEKNLENFRWKWRHDLSSIISKEQKSDSPSPRAWRIRIIFSSLEVFEFGAAHKERFCSLCFTIFGDDSCFLILSQSDSTR